MKISIFGLGYVGAIHVAYLSSLGHDVIGVDVVEEKVNSIQNGCFPIWEPGLDEMVAKDASIKKRITATKDISFALKNTQASIVCVGTPAQPSGSQDKSHILRTCQSIFDEIKKQEKKHTVIVRSTLSPGTNQEEIIPLLHSIQAEKWIDYFYAPEFLREGNALKDFETPPFKVYASTCDTSGEQINLLFNNSEGAPWIKTSFGTAEVLKYACNVFHALKVTFANEIGSIARSVQVDSREVMELFSDDSILNISSAYLRPGFSYGGSCLDKDLSAILNLANEKKLHVPLLSSIQESNDQPIQRLVKFLEDSGANSIGFWGVTFKPNTDDIRESPIMKSIEKLMGSRTKYKPGPQVIIYDRPEIEALLKDCFVFPHKFIFETALFVDSADLVILGTKPLTHELQQCLIKSQKPVIDLCYFDVPETIQNIPGYVAIS